VNKVLVFDKPDGEIVAVTDLDRTYDKVAKVAFTDQNLDKAIKVK
jgi:hypothetical protein